MAALGDILQPTRVSYHMRSYLRDAIPGRRLALATCLAFIACSSGDVLAPGDDRLVAQLDGRTWSGPAGAYVRTTGNGTDTLFLGSQRADERIHIAIPFSGVGNYELASGDVGLIHTVGGDVAISRYGGATEGGGQVRVLEYDGAGGILRAELTLELRHESGEPTYGATTRLTNGMIITRVHSLTLPE